MKICIVNCLLSKGFEIYRSINIKPWCAKIEDARKISPELELYLSKNERLDFGDPTALKIYNHAVAKVIADLDIQVPDDHLIPAVCLRYGYVRILYDEFLTPNSTFLEIGTGASAIISQFAAKSFNLNCYATEINKESFNSAIQNIKRNHLEDKISVILSKGQILDDLIDPSKAYDVIATYPPTYGESVQDVNKLNKIRGFKGVTSEMIGGGDSGFEFTEKYLNEATSSKYDIRVVSVLCLFKNHVKPSISILSDSGREVKVFEIAAGTRKRYLVVGLKQ